MSRWECVVDELYERDRYAVFADIENQPLTLRIKATHLQMLQALADRFPDVSRSALGADLLQNVIEQVFVLLDGKDRAELAKKADSAYEAFVAEKGVSIERGGMGYWEAQDWAYSQGQAEGEGK